MLNYILFEKETMLSETHRRPRGMSSSHLDEAEEAGSTRREG